MTNDPNADLDRTLNQSPAEDLTEADWLIAKLCDDESTKHEWMTRRQAIARGYRIQDMTRLGFKGHLQSDCWIKEAPTTFPEWAARMAAEKEQQ